MFTTKNSTSYFLEEQTIHGNARKKNWGRGAALLEPVTSMLLVSHEFIYKNSFVTHLDKEY